MSVIVAAVRFDANLVRVLRSVVWLAHATGSGIRLVHIFDPETPTGLARLAALHARLERYAARARRGGTNIRSEVLIGPYPESLVEHVAATAATLLVIGAHRGAAGFMSVNLRPLQRLITRAAIPMVVIPDGPSRRSPQTALRLLLTDDLTTGSTMALATTRDLLGHLDVPAIITHLHVAKSGDHSLDLLAQIRTRGRELAAIAEAHGGTYKAELWHGNTASAINRAAVLHATDLAIFGQHRSLHPERAALGNMSYRAMLGVPSAFLVAPLSVKSSLASPSP